MAAYDFGGGGGSSFSDFSQAYLAGGVAGAGNGSDGSSSGGNRSGEATRSASGNGVSWKTVGFVLLMLFLLYLQLKGL